MNLNRFFYVVVALAVIFGGIVGCDMDKHLPTPSALITEEHPLLSVTPDTLRFTEKKIQDSVTVRNLGTGTLNWVASINSSCLMVTPKSGTGLTVVKMAVNPDSAKVARRIAVPFESNGGVDTVWVVVKPTVTPTTLEVKSTPSGASVTVDGNTFGNTPTGQKTMTAGSHGVVVSKTGYITKTVTANVVANQANTVEVTLEVVTTPTEIILWEGTIRYGDCSANKEGQFPGSSFVLSGGSLTGTTPYVTVECSAGQQWYLLIYRSAGDIPEKAKFAGPGEHQICGLLPANFLGLRLGAESGCVTGKKISVKGQVSSMMRIIEQSFIPLHLEPRPEN